MKKQVCTIVLSAALLCGCSSISSDVQTRLNEEVALAQAYEPGRANCTKEYYSYYLDPAFGRLEGTDVSNRFTADGDTFSMYADISGIINAKYYQDAGETIRGSSFEIQASSEGIYRDASGTDRPYEAYILDTGDRSVAFLRAGYMLFTGITDEAAAPRMIGNMLKIAMGVRIDTEAVASAYSTKEIITYEAQTIELFDQIAPENGVITELLVEQPEESAEPDPDQNSPQE